MVVVKIGDGLGNQMFNYAFGYAFAKKNDEKLLQDISECVNSENRPYQLNKMNLEYKKTFSLSNRTVLHKIYKRLLINALFSVVKESPEMYKKFDGSKAGRKRFIRSKYLFGYWINPQYFLSYEDSIRGQFAPNFQIEKKIEGYKKRLQTEESCAIHMRGGDIPMQSSEYYRKAITYMERQANIDAYYIFTNERKKAEKVFTEMNLKIQAFFIDDIGSFDDFEELFLMSACRNQIMSNSTFSWWAAFLNENPDKIIIAPRIESNKFLYLKEWVLV